MDESTTNNDVNRLLRGKTTRRVTFGLAGAALIATLPGAKSAAAAPPPVTTSQRSTTTPQLLWTFPTGQVIFTKPAVQARSVLFGNWRGSLFAVDATTGDEQWRYTADGPVSADPIVRDDAIFAAGGNTLFRLDRDGTKQWEIETSDSILASPVFRDDIVYSGGYDGFLTAVAAETGEEVWRFNADGKIDGLTVDDDSIYFGSSAETFSRIDRVTGKEVWSVYTNGLSFTSAPIADGDRIYTGAGSYMLAFDAASGDELWRFETDDRVYDPVLVDQTLYFSDDEGPFYAIDAQTGDQLWQQSIDPGFGAPTVYEDVVYVGNFDESLHAFDARTGDALWSLPLGEPICSAPTIVDGTLYVGGYEGTLFALALESD